ncbi:MAG: hypothetical protein IJS17_03820 [Clostridia bacterium]|nr:hypothetical protein [Clostridia bacterium]
MREKDSEKTHLYSQDEAVLDEALKTFEKTVTSNEHKKTFSMKKLAVVMSVIVVLAAVTAVCFLYFPHKVYPAAVVKTSDGNYALAGKELVLIGHEIEKIDLSVNHSAAAFTDKAKNLYGIKPEKYKNPADAKLIAEKFDGEFFVGNENRIVYLFDGDLFCYDFKDSTKIAQNVTEVYHAENSENIFYLTSDKKLFKTDLKTSQQLSSDVKNAEFHSDGENMNLIFLSDGGLYFCDANAQVTLLSEKVEKWYCGESDEVWDNIYFCEDSQEKRQLNVEFSDEYAQSDSEMQEPSSSDYKKSLVFGLIQYVDPAQYKSAYVDYQKKLARDSVREYTIQFKNSFECLDVMCFNASGIQTVKTSVFEDEILFFPKEGDPQILINDLSAQKITLETAELVSDIKQVKTQEEFDKMIFEKVKSANSSDVKIIGINYENKFTVENIAEYDNVEFSKNGEVMLLEKDSVFSLQRINENSLATIFENKKISSYFFTDNKFIFTDENDELFQVVFLNDFEVISVAENVEEISQFFDGFLLLKIRNDNGLFDMLIYKTGETNSLAKNCSDFYAINDSEYFYISGNNIYCCYGEKLYVQNGVVEILK